MIGQFNKNNKGMIDGAAYPGDDVASTYLTQPFYNCFPCVILTGYQPETAAPHRFFRKISFVDYNDIGEMV